MKQAGFALFETSIGPCAIAWGERGVVGLQLPERTTTATAARMRKRFPDAVETRPPRDVARAMRDIAALLGGRSVDLSGVALDMDGVPPFHRCAYEAARRIPAGATRTYGELAAAAGSPNASRAIGQAMRRNPFPIVVPCHRVLASGGRTGGFTAEGGVDTKLRMLEIEGAVLPGAGRAKAAARSNGDGARTTRPSGRTSGTKAETSAASRTGSTQPAATRTKAVPVRANGDLPYDARRALRDLRASDATLARLIDEVGPLRLQLKSAHSVFGALAEAIVYQQLTGKAAATIYGRVCALFPRSRGGFTPEHILGASDEALRGAGLSRAKAAALRDLADKTAAGVVPTIAKARRMDDAELIDHLTQVRGIGRWTVEMLLIFRLARPDVLPVDDYGVRKGFAIAWNRKELPTAKELARYGERWQPWRSVASWYLWRATDRKPK